MFYPLLLQDLFQQHSRLDNAFSKNSDSPTVRISDKAEGACYIKGPMTVMHKHMWSVGGGGMLSIAERVLNATKTFDQMTSATANKRKRKVQGPHDQKGFACICTIEDAGHPTAA